MISRAGPNGGPAWEDSVEVESLPLETTTFTTAAGDASASIWDLTQTNWHVDFLHTHQVGPDSHAATRFAISFTVDEVTNYRISGVYSIIGPERSGFFRVVLSDQSAGPASYLYNGTYNEQTWDDGIVRTLGSNPQSEAGSRVGTLVPGRNYRVLMDAVMSVHFSEPAAAGPAAGSGFVTMEFYKPLPALGSPAMALLAIALAALGARSVLQRPATAAVR